MRKTKWHPWNNLSRVALSLFAVVLMLLMFSPQSANAQLFTTRLTHINVGEGVVTLHQDAELEALVNGIAAPELNARSVSQLIDNWPDSTAIADSTILISTRRVRTIGYRIQVYAGGNNRTAKAEAYRMADLVRSAFPELSVYTHFISPRWICRVGDFRTNEEAREMLQKMRETQRFREASIVKSQIIVYQ